MSVVVPGEDICPADGFLKGHCTHVSEKNLSSSVVGVVERINKLVLVRAISGKYNGEIGDVVIGRIIQVSHSQKRWKVEINHKQPAVLQLSAINLPGGVQRRRTYEDQMLMRQFFVEGDLLSAEVQHLQHDGTVVLHTRNVTYGKIANGTLVEVSPFLIKRQKSHFSVFQEKIEIITGSNGYIWVGMKKDTQSDTDIQAIEFAEIHEKVARLKNSILALNSKKLLIYSTTIVDTYEESLKLGYEAKELIEEDVIRKITQKARDRIRDTLTIK